MLHCASPTTASPGCSSGTGCASLCPCLSCETNERTRPRKARAMDGMHARAVIARSAAWRPCAHAYRTLRRSHRPGPWRSCSRARLPPAVLAAWAFLSDRSDSEFRPQEFSLLTLIQPRAPATSRGWPVGARRDAHAGGAAAAPCLDARPGCRAVRTSRTASGSPDRGEQPVAPSDRGAAAAASAAIANAGGVHAAPGPRD